MRASLAARAAAVAAAAAAMVDGALFDTLSASKFLNLGLVNATDSYKFLSVACGYLGASWRTAR
jgi:hypothetical protein